MSNTKIVTPHLETVSSRRPHTRISPPPPRTHTHTHTNTLTHTHTHTHIQRERERESQSPKPPSKTCPLYEFVVSAVPAGSPSRGGDVAVYVFDINHPSFAHPCLFCSCVCFCLHGPFNCISFHKFSRQLSAFSICSSGLVSASLLLSTLYLFMNVSLSPDMIPCS